MSDTDLDLLTLEEVGAVLRLRDRRSVMDALRDLGVEPLRLGGPKRPRWRVHRGSLEAAIKGRQARAS